MGMKIKTYTIILLSIIIFSLFFLNNGNILNSTINKTEDKSAFHFKEIYTSPYPPINIDPINDVEMNTTEVKRFTESINITLIDITNDFNNLTKLHVYINITYYNGTMFNHSMTKNYQANITYFIFTPEIYDPLGLYNVTFQIFNLTWGLQNTQNTITNFTVTNNFPQCAAYLNSTNLYKNQFLKVDISPSDIEDPLSKLNWNITIVDSSYNFKKAIDPDLLSFTIEIDETFLELNAQYYVKINVTDADSNHSAHYFGFQVLNSPPEIIISLVSILPSTTVKRSTDTVDIKLNVTDVDHDYSDINVDLIVEDTNGGQTPYTLTNNEDGSYDVKFTIPATSPLGTYNLKFTARDVKGSTDEYTGQITVINNPPKILGYKINNISTENSVIIQYGEDLEFTFNISDVEPIEGLGFVRVCLLNPNNEWFNLSIKYSENASLTIRTEDLVQGTWYVYVYVIDADGVEVGLDFGLDDAPQEIIIITSLLPIFEWIFLIIAVVFGFGLGYLVFSIINSRKKAEVVPPTPSEEAKLKKKIQKPPKKEAKPVKEEPKDKKKAEAKHSEKAEEEEEEKAPPKSQLKIKRKLR